MLPKRFRFWLFDRLSVKTMRHVSAVPTRKATGLVREVYDQVQDDFFINGSLTSRSAVPELLAAIWTAGRETILVDDHLDRTTKEAVAAVLSYANDCAYCADMLVSLTHAGNQHDAAGAILDSRLGEITDPVMRRRLGTVDALVRVGERPVPQGVFTPEELPEVVGTILAMADINRFSHVVMDGSPVQAGRLQGAALRWFGGELRSTKSRPNVPGRALSLLPLAPLPDDLAWAGSNPRIANALARWADTVERESASVISPAVARTVDASLAGWRNERMPLHRQWVERELGDLQGEERDIAKLAIVLAKASHQATDDLVQRLLNGDDARFVRILAWASSRAARRLAALVAERLSASEAVPAA